MSALQHETMTVRELRDRLDELARETLGLSAEEFVDRYRERRLDLTSPTVSRLATLARLLLASSTPSDGHA